MVYITRGLLTALLELSAERDPGAVTVSLEVTPAGELLADGNAAGPTGEPADQGSGDAAPSLPPEAPVFTDMYLPESGDSVSAVFGMDLSTPGAAGRFVSHPEGPLALTKRDDLHEVVFVAVPPYDDDCVAAFDRGGAEQPIDVVHAAPPPDAFEDEAE